MSAFFLTLDLHILTVVVSISLLVLRFYWKYSSSVMLQKRWVKILPHLNDTILMVSGIVLMVMTRLYPFTPQGSWMTEKLLGVILYILLGFVALSKKPRSQKIRWIAFILAVACFYLIVKVAITKLPLLIG
jgi:uncharacterized membrane protein SirB2